MCCTEQSNAINGNCNGRQEVTPNHEGFELILNLKDQVFSHFLCFPLCSHVEEIWNASIELQDKHLRDYNKAFFVTHFMLVWPNFRNCLCGHLMKIAKEEKSKDCF
ncbi:CLUMA_CG002099, isoform A [Clunio marinus]|uniref:CLUMA_CG002099, isoform A n=1 Tax=Clunio marinus TaxID=568069 RepID=A0A1J1HJT3_9DIPT|nr:CLUMA_CG002099, isoform A [Clunio marinus]